MIIQIRVCYKCPDRKLGCHTTCDKYIAEFRKNREIHEKYMAEKEHLKDIYNYRRHRKR